jgi:hypothetical protein
VLYYVSIANDHTGEWIGGVYVNAETQQLAGRRAAEIEGWTSCLSLAVFPVPAGSPAIPASFLGRVLSRAEVATIAELRHFFLTHDEGGIELLPS